MDWTRALLAMGLSLAPLACTSGGGGADGGPPGTPGACGKYCVPSGSCSDGGCNLPSQCTTDADCPATGRMYSANGPRCVSICGSHRLCRTPCTADADCKPITSTPTSCNGVADDGTHYCEIGLTACPTDQCPQYTTCWPSFRPAK